jgi:parallel beta-helix repeat protein
MKYILIKKNISIILIISLIIINFNFNIRGDAINNNILYVGGDGNGNYSKIQDAINDSKDGDKIFVYKGIYYENIIIDKSIIITGEEKHETIIDGINKNHVILVKNENINISSFTIQKAGKGFAGIFLTGKSNNTIIYNNIIKTNNWVGIRIISSRYNVIKRNEISYNKDGIHLSYECYYNKIIENEINNNEFYGIYIQSKNTNNEIYHNNFIKNGQNTHDEGINNWDDEWHGNYWDDYEEKYPDSKKILLKGIWNVAYEIPGKENIDKYPLIREYSENDYHENYYSINFYNSIIMKFFQYKLRGEIINE